MNFSLVYQGFQRPFRQAAQLLEVSAMLRLVLNSRVLHHPFGSHLIVREGMRATERLQGHSMKEDEEVLTDEIEPVQMLLKRYSLNRA